MGKVIRVFAGFDQREAIGYHAFCQSVIERASEPVSITPLHLANLQKVYQGGARDGTNAFIYSRFLIPYLCDFEGFAIFMDGADMICKADIAELWAQRDVFSAVQVVKHDYKTRNPTKYVGTQMEAKNEDYPRKNWSSVMIINCSHYAWRSITPEAVATMPGFHLHRFGFIEERAIGSLPGEWNWLADEYGPNINAKLLHWTAGIPAWPHYKDAPNASDWFHAHSRANEASS